MPTRGSRKTLALDLVLGAFRLANVLGQVGNRLAGAYGLTAQQWLALTSIGVAGEQGVSPTEIGKAALVSPQNVTGLLDRLERAGYVQRKPGGEDRRSYRVQLSGEGARVFHALNPLGATWAQTAVAEWPQGKIAAFHALLEEYLATATKAAFGEGQPGKTILLAQAAEPAPRRRSRRIVTAASSGRRPQRLRVAPSPQ
jgi:DNA-binding MarR family transcriptional regulator